jgi:molybdopterin-guanine dinucleotide biosynthesis protein A
VEKPAINPTPRLPISAYVLAGGKSSRMGTDKALLQLAGKPLIAHAVAKLLRITHHVHILSSNPALADFAPLVPDLHPHSGPIGGIEAALAHTSSDWNLILPVDIPLIPTLFLTRWVQSIAQRRSAPVRIAMFRVFGVPQPTLLLIHRDAAPFLTLAIARGEYKLHPALEIAARELAPPGARPDERVPYMLPTNENLQFDAWMMPPSNREPWQTLTPAQRAAQPLWFANLNTPEDFAEAEAHTAALDT